MLALHFINEQYELKHYLLETREFTESHTANDIALTILQKKCTVFSMSGNWTW